MISKMQAMLLSVFPLFKFRFDAPLIHISVDFIKSWAVAPIPGFFVCMWCATKNHCLANNILGISSRIQGIEMLSLGSLKTGAILLAGLSMHGIFWVVFTLVMLLFPPADAALPSSMHSIGDTVISGICVAIALCIAVPRGGNNRFFNYAFLRYTVSLTVIVIIMNWFQAARDGVQPALLYVASSVIGFVAVHCLWNGEVKQGDTNQLMSQVWDWNMYGTKLKKFHGWFLNTANEDCDRGEDDATAILQEDRGDGPKDDSSSGSDDHDGNEDAASEDYDDEIDSVARAVQILAICANFHISAINAYDWHQCRKIYTALEGEVQEEGMDLVLIGPYRILEAYSSLGLKVFPTDDEGSSTDDEGSGTGPLFQKWDVTEADEVEEYTQTIYGGLGRKLEITYLVIPEAVETHVEVRLNLKDLGSRSRAVYGSVKASAFDYGSKSVHLFSRERGRSLSLPCGSTCILPLSPYMIALPYNRHFRVQIEVDLITTCDIQEEDKNLKLSLDFSRRIMSQERLVFPRRIRSQEREVDGDQVKVNVIWRLQRS
ncbi:hypothetical protein EJB05_31036 [Eragrostis curvula]|uniref:DUF6598 domain-containing protein n=1 Tax=Eragrostis curvula TaxID=38414 RepID=A0A5J9UD49_9POAL|nr:hypothetical protein EJB05_31036 [Eragrostis curvula]